MQRTIWYIGGDDVRFRIPLLRILNENGFQVAAVGSEPDRVFNEHGINYYRYPLAKGLNPIEYLWSLYSLRKLFQHNSVDVVHAFGTKPAFLVPLAAFNSVIKFKARTIPGMGYLFSSRSPYALTLRPVYNLLQRLGSCLSDITVFQNNKDATHYLDHKMVPKAKHRIILGSGIDLKNFNRSKIDHKKITVLRTQLNLKDHIVVILVARMIYPKGIEEYLESARIVRSKYPKVCFLLVGPPGANKRQAIPQEKIAAFSEDVKYLGRRDDVRDLLSLADICVLPSYYREGIPRVLLEAGALGLPLITTDMPGCSDVVRHRWNGLLVPPRDKQALASALEQLISDEGMRKTMGNRSKRHVTDNFSLEKIAKAYMELYKDLLTEKSDQMSA